MFRIQAQTFKKGYIPTEKRYLSSPAIEAKIARPWFAWANTIFGEFLIKVEKEYPELL